VANPTCNRCSTSLLSYIESLGDMFERFEFYVELFLFWISGFGVTHSDIKKGYFTSFATDTKLPFAVTNENYDYAKDAIDTLLKDFQERRKDSQEKTKLILQITTFVFTINITLLTLAVKYSDSNLLSFSFALSLALLAMTIFMIKFYYKVTKFEQVTIDNPGNDIFAAKANFLEDKFFCVSRGNDRLNYYVTIYKSALRFFTFAIMVIVFGVGVFILDHYISTKPDLMTILSINIFNA